MAIDADTAAAPWLRLAPPCGPRPSVAAPSESAQPAAAVATAAAGGRPAHIPGALLRTYERFAIQQFRTARRGWTAAGPTARHGDTTLHWSIRHNAVREALCAAK